MSEKVRPYQFDFRNDGVGRGLVSSLKVKAPPAGLEASKY